MELGVKAVGVGVHLGLVREARPGLHLGAPPGQGKSMSLTKGYPSCQRRDDTCGTYGQEGRALKGLWHTLQALAHQNKVEGHSFLELAGMPCVPSITVLFLDGLLDTLPEENIRCFNHIH